MCAHTLHTERDASINTQMHLPESQVGNIHMYIYLYISGMLWHGTDPPTWNGLARHGTSAHGTSGWRGTARPILARASLARHCMAWHGTALARPMLGAAWHGTFWRVACLGTPCCMAPPREGHSTFSTYFTNRSHGEMKSDHQACLRLRGTGHGFGVPQGSKKTFNEPLTWILTN